MIPPASPGGWLLVAALLALGVLASRRRMWEGTPPRVWWAEQRMYRRPRAVIGRTARVLLGAALITVAGVALVGVVLTVVVAALLVLAGALVWYAAHRLAIRVEPTTDPMEDGRAGFLLDLGDDPFDMRLVNGDLDLDPDPDTPVHRPEHYRAEIHI